MATNRGRLLFDGSYSRAVTINFSTVQVRLLTEGDSYSRAVTINFSTVQVRLLIEGGSYSMALIRGRLLLISALFKCGY